MITLRAHVIRQLVARIPPGRVATYGQLAALTGMKGARAVGTILHANPDPAHIPCHRVVNAQGRLAPSYAFGGARAQQKRLARERVLFKKSPGATLPFVDLDRCRFHPTAQDLRAIRKALSSAP